MRNCAGQRLSFLFLPRAARTSSIKHSSFSSIFFPPIWFFTVFFLFRFLPFELLRFRSFFVSFCPSPSETAVARIPRELHASAGAEPGPRRVEHCEYAPSHCAQAKNRETIWKRSFLRREEYARSGLEFGPDTRRVHLANGEQALNRVALLTQFPFHASWKLLRSS